jgi:putative aldouronate transport system substrate-binding protein
MYRKSVTLLIALSLLLLGSVSSFAEEAFAKYEEPVTITMATTLKADTYFDENDPEKKSMEENRWINAYAEKLGINVEYQWVAPDGDANSQKWITAIASDNLPDAGAVDNATYALLLDAGVVADMTDIFEEYASDDYRKNITNDMKAQLSVNGRMYGLPYSAKGYQDGSALFVRKDWLDKLGLAVPTNLNEVVEVARAFVDNKLGGEDTIGILLGAGNSNSAGVAPGGRWDGLFNPFHAYLNIWLKGEDGKLKYSNVDDNMKAALLFVQQLYMEGLINKDFAATTSDLATEYVSGGKCGIIYGVSWAAVTSIQALFNNDPEAEIVAITIPGLEGPACNFQANAPSVPKIFVNVDCKHPEAVVKLVNLTIDLIWNDANNYYRDESGFSWFKYICMADFFSMGTEIMQTSYQIMQADQTGDAKFTNPQWNSVYANYLKAKAGDRSLKWYSLLYGEGSLYMQYKDAYEAGLIVTNAFYGLDTETMALKKNIINEALMTSIIEVMMGADISVYEKAVEEWFNNGGQQITDEVNAWYATR